MSWEAGEGNLAVGCCSGWGEEGKILYYFCKKRGKPWPARGVCVCVSAGDPLHTSILGVLVL